MRHEHMIPHFKIIHHFVSEVLHTQEYQSYIVSCHKLLIKHVKMHGEHSSHNANFTLYDVYEDLISCSLPEIPTLLTPSPNLLPPSLPLMHQQSNNTFDMNADSNQGPSIVALTIVDHYDNWYCNSVDGHGGIIIHTK